MCGGRDVTGWAGRAHWLETIAHQLISANEPGKRRIWCDLEGTLGPEFDEPLEEFNPYR